MPYDEDLADRLRGLLGGEPHLTEKRLFGGLGFFISGTMAVCASGQGGLLVRVDPDDAEQLLRKPGAEPMLMRGRPAKGWLRVAPEQVRTSRQLSTWVDRGAAYARSLPAKSG